MALAIPMQKLQDWLTQQWVIIRGRKIDPTNYQWLLGPFGSIGGVGEAFIYELAEKEGLIVKRNSEATGLIPSIQNLNLLESELSKLSPAVIDFYQNTSDYELSISVKWNPFFRFFGTLVGRLFSNRINQLNLPTQNLNLSESITSELITLADPISNERVHTIWFRTLESTGQVVYSGVYGTCELPSGQTCIKAVFPLPNGNATVLMSPSVGESGELILESLGQSFGDAGFYFLLVDSKGTLWSQYIKPFRDRLIVNEEGGEIFAEQILTLWHRRVLVFRYCITPKSRSRLSIK